MNIIDSKLIDAYTVLVLVDRYIINETYRTNEEQKLVPEQYRDDVEVQVAERIIQGLYPGNEGEYPEYIKGELQQRIENLEETIGVLLNDEK